MGRPVPRAASDAFDDAGHAGQLLPRQHELGREERVGFIQAPPNEHPGDRLVSERTGARRSERGVRRGVRRAGGLGAGHHGWDTCAGDGRAASQLGGQPQEPRGAVQRQPNREVGDDWRAYFDERTDQGLLDRLFAGPAAEVLEALALPYAELRVDYGMLTVRRNGYLLDPDALDELARATCLFADTLRDVCLTGDPWSSFDDPLPPCPWADEDRGIDELGIAGAWSKDFRDFAARHDLVLEDPAAWHELFPTQPVPGRVVAAMRGQLDDTGLTGRLLFTTDLLIPTTRAVRGAIAVPAARSADETPPGGIRPDGAGMTCNVRDGIATVWTHRHYGYCSEAEGLAAGAVAAGRAAGTLR